MDDSIPGTGAELAGHLLDQFDMTEVSVLLTDKGAHYDLDNKIVALSECNYTGKSLTTIAVAAHETGHAIQHHNNDRLLTIRSNLASLAQTISRLGSLAMMIMPFAVLITKNPAVGFKLFFAGFLSIADAAIVHFTP